MKKTVHTDQAPAAIGPYSQAIRSGNFVFVSGQLPIDPATGELIGDDTASQTRQCLKNLEAILKAAGSAPELVVKTTVYLDDIADFAAMNDVYAKMFATDPPARAAFEVASLPKGARVEIEAIAVVS